MTEETKRLRNDVGVPRPETSSEEWTEGQREDRGRLDGSNSWSLGLLEGFHVYVGAVNRRISVRVHRRTPTVVDYTSIFLGPNS